MNGLEANEPPKNARSTISTLKDSYDLSVVKDLVVDVAVVIVEAKDDIRQTMAQLILAMRVLL
jgi:hypothetical protein